MKIRNAKPRMFYGLHFQEGVAEYKDLEGQPVVYINEVTAKGMDKSFQGKPVYVLHEEEVDLENVQEADGVVIRSFYNKCDGNHWVEFMVYTDEAIECIEKKMWKLSNAYLIKENRGSGSWHGVDYNYEVAEAEYEHLAIVPNPRYADSIILNAEDFKQYNLDKEEELVRLSNSKGEKGMFNLFKKKKVENSKELAEMSVILPKSKVEKTITQLVNEADESEEKKGMANMEDEVELENGDKVSVKNLLDTYKKNMEKEDDVENSEDGEEDSELENGEDEEEVENESGEEEDSELENEEEEEEEPKNMKKKNSKKVAKKKTKLSNAEELEKAKEAARVAADNFAKLSNANKVHTEVANSVDLGEDKVARGQNRYGSN